MKVEYLSAILIGLVILNGMAILASYYIRSLEKTLSDKEEKREDALFVFKTVNGDKLKEYAKTKQQESGVGLGEVDIVPIVKPVRPGSRKNRRVIEETSNYLTVDPLTLMLLSSTADTPTMRSSYPRHSGDSEERAVGEGSSYGYSGSSYSGSDSGSSYSYGGSSSSSSSDSSSSYDSGSCSSSSSSDCSSY